MDAPIVTFLKILDSWFGQCNFPIYMILKMIRSAYDLGILNSDLESYYMFQRNLLAKRRTWLQYGEKIRELQVKKNIKLGYYNFRIRFVDGCYSLFIWEML